MPLTNASPRRLRVETRTVRKYEKLTHPLHARVDPETREQVDAYARKEKCSHAEAVRRLVELGLETDKQN